MKINKLLVIIFFVSFIDYSFSQEDIKSLNTELEASIIVNDTLNLKVINFFKKEEKGEFVSNGRGKELYNLINLLKDKALINANNTLLFFKLRMIIKKNVELSEYMSECISDIAFGNTEEFLVAFYLASDNIKNKIEEDLFWLIEKDRYNSFKEKVNEINTNGKYKNTVSRLLKLDED